MKPITFVFFFFISFCFAQERIDGDFEFESDPAKKFSLYIPSGYDELVPNKVMLALHPFNPARWDAESWCDTLTDFAEENQLILICPDGGVDGRIDDPIDTAFTSALIDSVTFWYNLDIGKFYGMGFSWGARGIYTYGLSHDDLIKGYIPVGAAINGTSEVNESLQLNAAGKPFYIVHGNLDAPGSRFFPIRDSLISKGAIVETNLMSGVGHTIDFPDRNAILTTAFDWIDSVNCSVLGIDDEVDLGSSMFSILPNLLRKGELISIFSNEPIDRPAEFEIWSMEGKLITQEKIQIEQGKNILDQTLPQGKYVVKIRAQNLAYSGIILVVEW